MDKTKKAPLPERTPGEKQIEKEVDQKRSASEPTYIRGTIDPPTKKER